MAGVCSIVSALLALAGIYLGVAGIYDSQFKQTATGLILIFGAGVFALLTIGARRRPRQPLEWHQE